VSRFCRSCILRNLWTCGVDRERRYRRVLNRRHRGGGAGRKILAQVDGPVPSYPTIVMDVILELGVTLARHSHREITMFWRGTFQLRAGLRVSLELEMRSRFRQECRMVVEGQETKTRLLINYIVEGQTAREPGLIAWSRGIRASQPGGTVVALSMRRGSEEGPLPKASIWPAISEIRHCEQSRKYSNH
jgi:hypothetical protein